MFAGLRLTSPTPEKAGDGNRTHVACLEGRYSTIELHPRFRPPSGVHGTIAARGRSCLDRFPGTRAVVDSRVCLRWLTLGSSSDPFQPIGSDMGGAGFEPAKALPPDLQSGPFGRLGIHPINRFRHSPPCQRARRQPGTIGTTVSGRAGGETRTHNPRFTKPMLCRLSYASSLHREIVYYNPQSPRCKVFPKLSRTCGQPRAHHRAATQCKNHTAVNPDSARPRYQQGAMGDRRTRCPRLSKTARQRDPAPLTKGGHGG